ncbi:MAG: right-handed parallel beta-helix repeat-containing protein [Methanobrevibacter sp.]|nr:right-handed parallel beta-helix repeat-containing protein [Methanobrevibacter sp.]
MSINKKIFCLLIVLIFCLGVSSASAADVTSDIIASEDTAVDADVIGEASFDENLGAGETYVVTNTTFNNYFTNGELNGNVSAGSTLDFQGTFTGVDYKVNITKPVNIISSTGDALFNDIGKKDSTGGCFHISNGGSGTNVTDLSFINSAFYVTNASDVNIENIYMMANTSGVGSGTGFMCVQAGSRYVTVKDSYFENRGTGSSILVIGYSDYCTIDNNEIVINGSSGNALYITTYVPAKWTGTAPTGNVISNNYIHGEKSGLCMALVVAGNGNIIDSNVIDYNGASGIANQFDFYSTPSNNTYTDNVLTGGCSFTAAEDSYVSGNTVEGSMTVGSNSIVEDNVMASLSLSKPNCIVDNNVIGEKGVTFNVAALNTTLTNNVILSKVNVKSNNNTIQNNTIQSDDEYAIDLFTTTGNEVSDNNLISANFTGDAAVNAGEGNSVHDNGGIDNIVTKDNFFYFFDENGNYRNLNFTDLIFKGDFDSLVDAITINQTLSIEGLNANLNDMAFILLADGITLNDLELNFDKAPVLSKGSAILINAPNVSITNITANYAISESADAYVIYAENADNLTIEDNVIDINATSDGAAVNNAISILESAYVLVENNVISAYIPSCAVSWKEFPPGSGIWVGSPVSEGVVFDGCSDLTVADNIITVVYNDVVGNYDTLYAVDIKNCENVEFLDNTINGLGHSYIYGLYVESDNLIVDGNIFSIISDIEYANGIEVEASTDAVISNNTFEIAAPKFAYAIYTGMNGGDLEVDYIGNDIEAIADIVYGMELCGNLENVYNNTITVEGNKTTALAIKSKESYIYNNTINALGDNLGNSTSVDSFAAITAGINLQNSDANVEKNIINSKSIGILVNDGEVIIENNEINVEDNALDNSYAIIAEDAVIDINSNNITYVGATDGSTVNNVINLNDCAAVLSENEIDASIPSCYVDWKEEPAGSGIWVKYPVSEAIVINGCPDLVLTNNDILVEAGSIVGAYDTIYVMDIKDCENALISENDINALGHSYIYGLYIEADNATVEGNAFGIESDSYYANGIEVEASQGIVITDNVIEIEAPLVYGIYSGMNGGDLEAEYSNNLIYADGDFVYGMELMGLNENVLNNTFVLDGSDAIGIYSFSNNVTVKDNAINITAEEDSLSLAFLGKSGNATITDNEIQVTGEYTIDVSSINSLVKDNYLVADVLTGDASVDYDLETSSVYNNTPKKDKYFISTEGLVKYFGNAEALEFVLTDASGNPVANQSIKISIRGIDYTRKTDANGTARMAINLDAGDYNAIATYENQSVVADISIISTIWADDLTKMFKNATQFEATFVDSDGNLIINTDVKFNINGLFYTRKTNENGTAKLNINLEPGEYIITSINPVTSESAGNIVTVLSTITDNNDLTKYYRNDSQYTVKILDSQGNAVGAGENVTFNINGVFYNRTTNASGIAKLNINLEPGDYIITAYYNGCAVANNIKVLPTLITEDLSMKYKDGSTFNATVLDGQGNPYPGQNVTFNVNGVFYNRLSDSNGVSKLNINLMPGTYIITSTYNQLNVANKITISS